MRHGPVQGKDRLVSRKKYLVTVSTSQILHMRISLTPVSFKREWGDCRSTTNPWCCMPHSWRGQRACPHGWAMTIQEPPAVWLCVDKGCCPNREDGHRRQKNHCNTKKGYAQSYTTASWRRAVQFHEFLRISHSLERTQKRRTNCEVACAREAACLLVTKSGVKIE